MLLIMDICTATTSLGFLDSVAQSRGLHMACAHDEEAPHVSLDLPS